MAGRVIGALLGAVLILIFASAEIGTAGAFIAAAAVLGLIPGWVAQARGYSFVTWWIFGTLLWIVALPISLMLPDRAHVRCPYCAEQVMVEAVVCPHCRSRLDEEDVQEPASAGI